MKSISERVILIGILMILALGPGGCSEGPEVFSFDPQEGVLDYIQFNPVGKELFATDYFFPQLPYTKPWDNEAVYIDRVDSSYRNIRVEDAADVFFESPIGQTDMAEVTVSDHFLIDTERFIGDSTELMLTEWRVVRRHALFLRLGSANQAYLGWVLHAFGAEFPRAGLTRAVTSSGVSFYADGLDQERLRYLVITGYNTVDSLGNTHWVVDTVARSTDQHYYLLDDIAEVPQGDTIVFTSTGMDGGSPSGTGTVYQLLTAEAQSGPLVRRMAAPDQHTYVDTLVTPANNAREWNIVLFQEFRRPDRQGAIWCAPYRTGP